MPQSSNPGPQLCRECRQEVDPDTVTCPHCGAARPALAQWAGEGYQWQTAATWLGAPLIHIAFGIDHTGKMRTARGIIAIGQRAVGLIAVGMIAMGGLTIGIISLGVVSLGVLSVALGAAVGINAIAPIAYGITSFGYLVGGLETFGWRIFPAPNN